MAMYFLSVIGEQARVPVKIRAWVQADTELMARQCVERDLSTRSIAQLLFECCETTERADYFPPCDSLDAFDQAARDGAAYRIVPR